MKLMMKAAIKSSMIRDFFLKSNSNASLNKYKQEEEDLDANDSDQDEEETIMKRYIPSRLIQIENNNNKTYVQLMS